MLAQQPKHVLQKLNMNQGHMYVLKRSNHGDLHDVHVHIMSNVALCMLAQQPEHVKNRLRELQCGTHQSSQRRQGHS